MSAGTANRQNARFGSSPAVQAAGDVSPLPARNRTKPDQFDLNLDPLGGLSKQRVILRPLPCPGRPLSAMGSRQCVEGKIFSLTIRGFVIK